MSVLKINNIGKAFRSYRTEWHRFATWFGVTIKPSEENWILRNINFEVLPGESVGIVGQNGAGKSTLLKLITGTLQTSEGEIIVNGRIAAILELGMGFNPELSGRDNVFHTAGLMGYSLEQITKHMPEIEAFAEIGEYFDEPIRTYSSGMQMRVAFAVATATCPEILIIDEALAVGDAAFQRKCIRRIEEYLNDGMSLLLVSHDIESIKKICTKALFLDAGHQQGYGNAKEICDKYERHLFGTKKKSDNSNKQSVAKDEKPSALIDPELLNVKELTYGDGRATIEEIWFENEWGERINVLATGSSFILKYRVSFNAPVCAPVFAFLIKTMEGISLYGSDTISLGEQIKAYESGDSIEVSFHLENYLAAGTYFINCGIRDDSSETPTFLHRRVDAAIFKVKQEGDINQTGLINMAATFASRSNK